MYIIHSMTRARDRHTYLPDALSRHILPRSPSFSPHRPNRSTQNIDTSTPEGRLFSHMTDAFDNLQQGLILENTRASSKAANKRGRRGGRPRAMNELARKHAEAMLKDTENCPLVGDVIDQL